MNFGDAMLADPADLRDRGSRNGRARLRSGVQEEDQRNSEFVI
jgi:hypothetical protein